MNFLPTKPQVKNMNNNYNDLYYTVNEKRDEKEIVNDQYEDNENDYINFNDFLTPNHYIGIKNNDEVLKYKKLRSDTNQFNKLSLYKKR